MPKVEPHSHPVPSHGHSEYADSGHTHPQYSETTHTHPYSDHGALTGLADDDHAQYVLASGTRAMSGDLRVVKATPRVQLYHGGVGAVSLGINGNKGAMRNETNAALTQLQVASPLVGDDAANKDYVDLRAPLASPALTGTPTAPTAAAGTSTTQLATTAFVTAADNLKANLASPTFTGDPKAPTPATTDKDTSIATTAFVHAVIPFDIQIGSFVSSGNPEWVSFPRAFSQTPVVVCQTIEGAREAYAAVLSTAPGSFQVITVNPAVWTAISGVVVHWIAMVPR